MKRKYEGWEAEDDVHIHLDKRVRSDQASLWTGAVLSGKPDDANSSVDFQSILAHTEQESHQPDEDLMMEDQDVDSDSRLEDTSGIFQHYPEIIEEEEEEDDDDGDDAVADRMMNMEQAAPAPEHLEFLDKILASDCSVPKKYRYGNSTIRAIVQQAANRNKVRVVRDIMPLLVPSAELLHIEGLSHLPHVVDEVNGYWLKEFTSFGPRPKPDYAAGLAATAFTESELDKLQRVHTSEFPNQFTDSMYLPFLLCEVSRNDEMVVLAEQRNMHSAGIVVKGWIHIYAQKSRQEELSGKILLFSVSHGPHWVASHGYYPVVTGDEVTIHRHLFHQFDFTIPEGGHMWRAYRFTRAIYDKFYPLHLRRIRDGLSSLSDVDYGWKHLRRIYLKGW